MKSKKILAILLFAVALWPAHAQTSDFDMVISRGISAYESGKYEQALSWFEQAYKLDRSSDVASYQVALTHLALNDHNKAAMYSAKVIDKGGQYCQNAYLVNASAWENLGRNEKAQRIYKEALKQFPTNHLLHYNLALSLYGDKKYAKAQEHAINSIEIYPAHASSHMLLAYIMFYQGERMQSMLPLYYFLLLEQDSDRSASAYDLLTSLWNQGVRKKGQRDIQLIEAGFKYDDFASVELAVSMIKASENITNKNSDETVLNNNLLAEFATKSKTLFAILKESSANKTGFWWDFYANFFIRLHNNNMSQPFSYFISACRYNQDALLWMSEHPAEFNRFTIWMEAQ